MRLVGSNADVPRSATFAAICAAAGVSVGCDATHVAGCEPSSPESDPQRAVPYMTEAWYCCAEPSLEDMRLV